MKKFGILLLVALAACNGDSTGSRGSLAGQWLLRIRGSTPQSFNGCQVVGAVRLTGGGDSFSGRMPVPEAACGGSYAPAFDSTTTVTAQVVADSVLLTVRANGYELRQTARLLGDSLGGTGSDGWSLVAARRYPDNVPLDRATVRLTGAVTRTVELYGYGFWNGLRFVSAAKDEGVLLLATNASLPALGVGTYGVSHSTATPLYGDYQRFSGNKVDPYVEFTSGAVTITQADAQLVTGTVDVTGSLNDGPEQVRVQIDFTSHRSGFPQ